MRRQGYQGKSTASYIYRMASREGSHRTGLCIAKRKNDEMGTLRKEVKELREMNRELMMSMETRERGKGIS